MTAWKWPERPHPYDWTKDAKAFVELTGYRYPPAVADPDDELYGAGQSWLDSLLSHVGASRDRVTETCRQVLYPFGGFKH